VTYDEWKTTEPEVYEEKPEEGEEVNKKNSPPPPGNVIAFALKKGSWAKGCFRVGENYECNCGAMTFAMTKTEIYCVVCNETVGRLVFEGDGEEK
jgi:hypothetical protein